MFAQEYDNFSIRWMIAVAATILLLSPALASAADGPDPILSGPVPGPCAAQASGADYVDGIDATGNPVTPAEGPGASSTMGNGTVELNVARRHGSDVTVPVHLADLSPPSCTAHSAPPARSPH
jgi:hypothetical protein